MIPRLSPRLTQLGDLFMFRYDVFYFWVFFCVGGGYMTGKTHKRWGVCGVYIVFALLLWFGFEFVDFGLGYGGVRGAMVGVLHLALMVCASHVGSVFPDYDHDKSSISEYTLVAAVVSNLCKLFHDGHRSRLTHSWDISLLFCGGTFVCAYFLTNGFTEYAPELWIVALGGFWIGYLWHLLMDMMNGVGVYFSVFSKHKVAFVPRKFFGLKFVTGGAWEEFCYKVGRVIDVIGLWACLFLIIYRAHLMPWELGQYIGTIDLGRFGH